MAAIVTQEEQPISRTYQYRKVMKPLLERKRRARINRCLEELKELLVGALQAEGESVSRLEKADVLELTVRHLHKLRRSQQISESSAGDRFRAGFVHCANEVAKYMSTMTVNTVDISVSSRLVSHLDQYIRHIENSAAPSHHHPHHSQLSPPLSSGGGGGGGGNTTFGTPLSVVQSQNSPPGMNILTTYTPPTSPISSPANNQSNGKLFAFIPSSSASSSSSACSAGSLSPIPPAHFHSQQQQIYGSPNGVAGMPQPLSLCMKEEPFDLSNNVWRPW